MADESSSIAREGTVEEGERRSYLPVPLTPLVGREREMHQVRTLLLRPEVRLLTLTGTGGIGKTRLGLQLALELQAHFNDGVFFISLATTRDVRYVPFVIAQALGMGDSGEQPVVERLKAFLEPRQTLLFLDNVEQVLDAAPLLVELLMACPHVKALVTSRAVLHVRGEYEYPVPPLTLPDVAHLPDRETLLHYSSVALFMQRAGAVRPGFLLTQENARSIAQVCIALEGIPLAIELAAAYIKFLSPQALLHRLNDRLSLLTGGAQDLPERQQTLRNTIQWSYDLLTSDEQRLFCYLSVFVGGCTLRAAESIGAQLSLHTSMLTGIMFLVDKSLLRYVEQADLPGDPGDALTGRSEEQEGESRLVMLETLREYGLECLKTSQELTRAQTLHAGYFLALAEEAEPHMSGSEQVLWLQRLEREHDNLRAALHWLLEAGEHTLALRLCSALYWFWSIRGHLSEGRHWFTLALAQSEQVAPEIRAKALNAAGALAYNEDEHEQSEQHCEEALALYRALGDKHGCAVSLYWLGQSSCWTRHQYERARQQGEEALTLFEETGDRSGVADALLLLAYIHLNRGEYDRARLLLEQGLVVFRSVEDAWGIAYTLHYLGRTLFTQGDYAKAEAFLEESLAVSERLVYKGGYANALGILGMIAMKRGDSARAKELLEESLVVHREAGGNSGIATALIRLAKLFYMQHDYATAYAYYQESLTLLKSLNDQETLITALEGLGEVLAVQGQITHAVHLWGAAVSLRNAINMPISPAEHDEHVEAVKTTRLQLGDELFTTLYCEGQAMTPLQALEEQPGKAGTPNRRDTADAFISLTHAQKHTVLDAITGHDEHVPPLHAGLTGREIEVLRLVAMGYTNPQIARRLSISPLTVNAHLRSVYNKLEVSSRSAATRYAIEQKLI